MELIVINDLQIKLTLTRDDLGRYPPDAETGEIFREILRDAYRLGLDGTGASVLPDGFAQSGGSGRLYVQMYPSRGGGCELFVTRLPSLCAAEGKAVPPSPERSARNREDTGFTPVTIPPPSPRFVYAFDSLGLLLRCCAGLSVLPARFPSASDGGSRPDPSMFWKDSAAYASPDRRRCYLVLPEDTPSVGEYLGALCPEGTFAYINEHCVLLCSDNAVPKLGELA